MANWYYFDEKGKKIGPVESSMLKTLVHVGVITPETILENESGTRYQAFKVKEFGLERPKEPTPPPPTLTPSQKKLHGGVWHHRSRETPIAVIDFETTGLTAGFDRVVEVSVVRIEPGQTEPILAFDSLVNPLRPVTASHVHGITDEDVARAPKFTDLAGDFLDAISGCVVASYNIYFDMRFLEYELRQSAIHTGLPYFCIMYLRTAIGLGSRTNLENACREAGVDLASAHLASDDAMAAAHLLQKYIDFADVSTFNDLTKLRKYKFWDSFEHSPIGLCEYEIPRQAICISRAGRVGAGFFPAISVAKRSPVASYTDAVLAVVDDFRVEESELAFIKEEQKRLNLSKEQIRAVHAQIFSSMMADFIDDEFLDDEETKKLQHLWKGLHSLGWAPGLFTVT